MLLPGMCTYPPAACCATAAASTSSVLQSLQAEAPGQTDPYSHALHFTPAAAHSPAPGGLLPPASSLAAAADTGLTGAPAAVAAAMAAFADDEDDDDEFQLDPLDWLVDDERDAEEEERLAQFVQVKQTHPTAIAGDHDGHAVACIRNVTERVCTRRDRELHMVLINGSLMLPTCCSY